MTQNITIQVGQCGNQIGCRFWDLALREHANVNKKGVYDESLGTFFRNVDPKRDINLPFCNRTGKIQSLKARAILIDTEEGVVNQIIKGPLNEVFDHRQYVTDVSGAGNNWVQIAQTLVQHLTQYIQYISWFCKGCWTHVLRIQVS
jgi:tubulin epsilon